MSNKRYSAVTLVFESKFRSFVERIKKNKGITEMRYRSNADKSISARFVMEASVIPTFLEAADEFGFDADETLRNFDLLKTSSDASTVAEAEGEDPEMTLPDQDVELDGIGEDEAAFGGGDNALDKVGEEADGGGEFLGNEDETGKPPVDPLLPTADLAEKPANQLGEEDSLSDWDKAHQIPAPTFLDKRPKKISQPKTAPNEGDGGEVEDEIVKVIASESFVVPGYRIKIEKGDTIRIKPKRIVRVSARA